MLSLLIWNGIFGALLTAFLGYKNDPLARYCALTSTGIGLFLFMKIWAQFDAQMGALQLVERLPWIGFLGIDYYLGIDGVSLVLMGLTLFTTLIIVLISWRLVHEQVGFYLGIFLFMQSMILGVFSAQDAILFYFFWEGMLLPMYLCIGVWGSSDRSYAAMKFFLYTFLGSVVMLVGLVYLGLRANGFALEDMVQLSLSWKEQCWLFWSLLLAFAVKIPMWPVHTWLPDAHTEAPAGGSVILAALMLKVGAYGLIRLSLPILPDACRYFSGFMIVLSLIAIIYVGIVALSQKDIKRLIAYSSVAHMGFVTLGIFLIYQTVDDAVRLMSFSGSLVQMIAHAFGSGALFLAFGLLYAQTKERSRDQYSGLGQTMPMLSTFFMIFCFSTIGVPGTAGFVGEWLIILSAIQANVVIGILAASTLVISVCYLLWMYREVFFGAPSLIVGKLTDISMYEVGVLSLLVAAILIVGIYPAVLFDVMNVSTKELVQQSLISKMVSL